MSKISGSVFSTEVDDFDIKDFMEGEGIPATIDEHDRICALFRSVGFEVRWVQRGNLNPIWTVNLDGSLEGNQAEMHRAICQLLSNGGIPTPRRGLFIIPQGRSTRLVFAHDGGAVGKRITYLRNREGRPCPCREEFWLEPPF